MNKQQAILLLEKYIQYEETEYTIDEHYITFYKKLFNISNEDETLIQNSIGAKIHNIKVVQDNQAYHPIVSMRAHITFNNITYTLLAKYDTDIDIIILYQTNTIIKSICNINLPDEELNLLRNLSL